jgi:hypothetical protein
LLPVDFNFSFIVWNRKARSNKPGKNTYVFTKSINQLRSLKFLSIIISYIKFIDKIIIKEKPQILIISHYSLYLPFIIFSRERKDLKVILDVHDLPSFTNIIPFRLVLFFEKLVIRNVSHVILASKYFKSFYSNKRTLVIDNIPPSKNLTIKSINIASAAIIKIGFVGKLRYPDLYKLVIECVIDFDNLEFHFYGNGSAEEILLNYCRELNTKNIFFHGIFNKNDLNKIYSNLDLLWACYPSDNYNVKYATSNKALESLFFKTPCVFSSGTFLAEDFKNKNIGFSLNSNCKNEIINFLKNINVAKLNYMKENIKKEDTPDLDLYKKLFKEFLEKK